jgi:C-terminal processing protease CtpA/Prc
VNDTLSRVANFETGSWTVSIIKTNDKLIRVGVVVEPSSNTVLSVTADGVGSELGLLPGDVLNRVLINGENYDGNFSMIELTHGDQLSVDVLRNKKAVSLEKTVTASFIPRWELYSSSEDTLRDEDNTFDKNTRLQSKRGIALLKKLQERINVRLSEIYRLESKRSESDLKFDIHQKEVIETRLDMVLDTNSNQIIRVEQGGNAHSAGLKVGDVLVDIFVNDNRVNNISDLSINDGDKFRLKFERAGELQSIEFEIKPSRVPAWTFNVDSKIDHAEDSCGVITVFFDPPFTKDIYKVFLTEVDGDLLPKGKREDSITLSAGMHRILMHERIPSRLKRRNSKGKVVEFMVKPNKRYFLGAKYDRNERFSKQGKFWQPYVWKVEDYECSE